ncbi:aminoglycoside phosphotransferase family protein [Streptomyces canus]|uniref:phosphotransferase family protein n=1 Tax=Streptomyces canus TaxID=58343 RepID=UPI0030E1009C
MDFRPIERSAGAFQQSVSAKDIEAAVCRRVFGEGAQVIAAVELGSGMYNNVYRLELAGQGRPVILRVAPEEGQQFRSERQLMRNEYASVPWLSAIGTLTPRVIAVDWSHEVIGRDWMMQSFLDGVPASEHLRNYPRTVWPAFFRQMGAIAKTVHAVRGPGFGPVNGPLYGTWSQAVITSLEFLASDLDSVGLDATDVRKVAAVAEQERAVLDEITEPRLTSGDLWHPNVMLSRSAPEPVITGVIDLDRTAWSDPASDWTIRMAKAKADEREAFWETYGSPDRSDAARWRSSIYEARHLGALRLERHRLFNPGGVEESYSAMRAVLADLT